MNKRKLFNRDTQIDCMTYIRLQNLIVNRILGAQKLCTKFGGQLNFTLCSLSLQYSSPCGPAHNMTISDFVRNTS